MLLIYGKRNLRIKQYTHSNQNCDSCKAFDLRVKVYRPYFHLFFIPFFPAGGKYTSIECNSCRNPYRSDSLALEYEQRTKTPVYMYSGLIAVALLILLAVNVSRSTAKKEKEYVASPMKGDVYLINSKDTGSSGYYFLRVSGMHGDTILVSHNNYVYSRYVSRFDDKDFFDTTLQIGFTKNTLKQMLDDGEINAVHREYGDYEGFNRVR